MSSSVSCKVADFGCSHNPDQLKKLREMRRRFNWHDPYLIGTTLYMAPELIRGSLPTSSCDVFSLGIILYQMIAQVRDPYPGIDVEIVHERVSC